MDELMESGWIDGWMNRLKRKSIVKIEKVILMNKKQINGFKEMVKWVAR